MRRLLALAAALALAGCQVDVEGAACEVPGAGDQCPSGQRCGNDLRCSTRAASCEPCKVGERRCVDGDVRTCEDGDPVCGAWRVDVDCDTGLECRGSGAEAACFCPPSGGAEVVVDPRGGASAGGPAPTGARTPEACRFPTLEAGLAAARDGGVPVVVAAGAAAVYPVAATLAVPPGVTLRGDDEPPAPGRRVLSLEGELAAGVTLAEGAALSGFTVRNGTAPAAAGVRIACAGAAARLEDVVIGDPGAGPEIPPLAQGIRAEGACPVELTRVVVTGASGAGLLVARDAPEHTVVVADSTLEANGEGVRLTRGDLTLQRVRVDGSAEVGVIAAGLGSRLTVDQCTIRGSGDTGVTVSTSLAKVHLLRSNICGNGAVTERGAPYGSRKVGGIYLYGNPPPELALLGNAVHGNGGDQVLVASSTAWTLDGAAAGASACSGDANVFAGYASGYVGVYAASAGVRAIWNAWRGTATPSPGTDYAAGGGGVVEAGEQFEPARFCLVTTPLSCD